ncbi:MAG: KEOPS complex kinase/ATPase Bud32 [Candidatus Nanohaloarchaea archaeon]
MKGAEADIEFGDETVIKRRERKRYRHRDLDDKIRQERTETEKHLMKEAARHGANVPDVKKVDDSILEIDLIDGEVLKKVVEDRPELMEEYGRNVAYMHSADIIHGDLTTSNALYSDQLYIIDFGLSSRSGRIEDKAVDIHLLKQVLNSSHPEVAEEAWQYFVEGYREYEDADKVLEQLKDVESRGRYK